MAVLNRMPEKAIVDGFKGRVDFYVHKTRPMARRWPRYYPRKSTAAEKANQDSFAYINRAWATLPSFLQRQYSRMAQSTPFTGKDIYIRLYMNGLNP